MIDSFNNCPKGIKNEKEIEKLGERVYERWNGATNAERIKLLSGSPHYWWLRSPNVGYTSVTRGVNASGTLHSYNASITIGLAPGLAVY
jgi:hypothetical protein